MSDDKERRVRERAYALWESEGRPAGRHESHWRQANDEIDAPEPATEIAPKAPADAPVKAKTKAAVKSAPVKAKGTPKTKPAAEVVPAPVDAEAAPVANTVKPARAKRVPKPKLD